MCSEFSHPIDFYQQDWLTANYIGQTIQNLVKSSHDYKRGLHSPLTEREPDAPYSLTEREPKPSMIASPAADKKPLQIGPYDISERMMRSPHRLERLGLMEGSSLSTEQCLG